MPAGWVIAWVGGVGGADRDRFKLANSGNEAIGSWFAPCSCRKQCHCDASTPNGQAFARVSPVRKQGRQGRQLLWVWIWRPCCRNLDSKVAKVANFCGHGSWQPCWSETVQQGCQVGSLTRASPTIEARFRLGFPAFRYGGPLNIHNTNLDKAFRQVTTQKATSINQIPTRCARLAPFWPANQLGFVPFPPKHGPGSTPRRRQDLRVRLKTPGIVRGPAGRY